jgi:hypothetical protein
MRGIGCAVLVALFVANASAQEAVKPKPLPAEEMKQAMEASMGAMAPMMARVAELTLQAQLNVAENPETARKIAAFKRNLFDALQKQGFSRDEAFSIMLATQLPSTASVNK